MSVHLQYTTFDYTVGILKLFFQQNYLILYTKYRGMNISYLCEKCFIWTSPCFLLGSVLFIFLVFCVVLLCFFTILVPCCEDRYALHITTMFGSSLPAVVCRRANVLFTLFMIDCVWCFFFVCLRLVSVPYVANFSGLSIFDCPFGIL